VHAGTVLATAEDHDTHSQENDAEKDDADHFDPAWRAGPLRDRGIGRRVSHATVSLRAELQGALSLSIRGVTVESILSP
jgi:hypothetical protein